MNKPLRIGIAGLGTVGSSLVNLIQTKQNLLSDRCGRAIRITAVCARDKTRDRGCDVSAMKWYDDPDALAVSDEIDCYIELIGSEEGPARTRLLLR